MKYIYCLMCNKLIEKGQASIELSAKDNNCDNGKYIIGYLHKECSKKYKSGE